MKKHILIDLSNFNQEDAKRVSLQIKGDGMLATTDKEKSLGIETFSIESKELLSLVQWKRHLEKSFGDIGFTISSSLDDMAELLSFQKEGISNEVTVFRGRNMILPENAVYLEGLSSFVESTITYKEKKLSNPKPDLAFLIRDKYTDEELSEMFGFGYLIIMHKPIVIKDEPRLLRVYRDNWGHWRIDSVPKNLEGIGAAHLNLVYTKSLD